MTTWITGSARVSFFFEAPNCSVGDHAVGGRVSTLYLLRRELLDTLGHDPDTVTESDAAARGVQHRAFASSMLMLTLLDLLAKFAYRDKEGEVGKRFRQLLAEPDGAALPRDHAKVFWYVRNSLMHAFGLPHEGDRKRLRLQDVGAWRRHPTNSEICAEISGGQAMLYVDGVYSRVLRTIHWSHEKAKRAPDSARFEEMFSRYGSVFFGHG
jgi:hypothetical protein